MGGVITAPALACSFEAPLSDSIPSNIPLLPDVTRIELFVMTLFTSVCGSLFMAYLQIHFHLHIFPALFGSYMLDPLAI